MKNVTNVDAVDCERFTSNESKLPSAVAATLRQQSVAFKDLLVDAFGALVKYNPMVRDEVDPDRQLNQHIIQQMLELNEYKQLRNFTVGDTSNAMGSLSIVKQIWDKLPQSVKQAQQTTDHATATINEALNSDEYDPTVLEDLFKKENNARTELAKQVKEYDDEIRQVVRGVLAQAEKDAADGEQAVAALGWGGGNGGPQSNPSTDDKLRIMSALKQNRQLQEILRLAGRMTNIAQKKQRQKATYFRTEMVGIEQGDSLPDVIPSEFGYMMHGNPALKALFLKRLSQAELLQYEMESREPKAKGPVIVEIDCSGSMSGEPDTWSKACALAMYSIARKQKRDFGVLLFTTRVQREVFIKKGEHKSQDLINILTAGTGGGTSFESPLGRAIELMKMDEHKQADLIVITDGICDISDSFKAQYASSKKDLQFSTYSILIGGGAYEKKIAEKFSDSVTELEDMITKNEGQAFNAAFSI